MKIAIPDAALYAPLVANAQAECDRRGWQLVRAPIETCGTLLLTHSVDAALVSPLGYGRGVGRVDYRLVPGPALMLYEYTNAAGITFAPHVSTLQTAASSTPEEFLVQIGALILGEKLDATLTLNTSPSVDADCLINLATPGTDFALDISEEWFDLTDAPLPAALWACRIEADLEVMAQAVDAMADATAERPVREMVPPNGDHFPREGRITYRWNDDSEEALAAALDMLFFRQVLREIPAVKLLGRD
ncbi:MAG: hypothetical protein FGM24_01740 [Candidatus Kapabacteria bacterium]|nr:hypothetical protein [Candidatus Kapabacteria bacterium]